MEGTVAYHAQTTADIDPVIFRMELVLDVKLDIKEQFVQWVFLVRFFITSFQRKTFILLFSLRVFILFFLGHLGQSSDK